jgi:signal transduction histidine kinase
MDGLAVASLVVLAVVSVIWTVALVAVALELRRASWRIQEFIRSLELDLKPTMQEARQAIRTLKEAAQGAVDTTERVRAGLLKLEQAGENVIATTGRIRSALGLRLIPAAGLLAGVRAGTKVLWNLYTRRR